MILNFAPITMWHARRYNHREFTIFPGPQSLSGEAKMGETEAHVVIGRADASNTTK
jgi:hypothetical protein